MKEKNIYEMVCNICGFMTCEYKEMIKHLAQEQILSKNNCKKPSVFYLKPASKKLNRELKNTQEGK